MTQVDGSGRALAVGITTPVLTMLPDAHASWEVDGVHRGRRHPGPGGRPSRLLTPDLQRARHLPPDIATVRGSRYWDPLATFGYLAAVTSRIRFATNVLVLGYHHPLEIAKRYGTLDRVSGGRVILGLGVGSLTEEFELLGAPFDGPGRPGRRRAAGPAGARGGRNPPTTDRTTVLRWVVDPLHPADGAAVDRRPQRAGRCGEPSSWATAGSPSGSGAAEMGDVVGRQARETPAWTGRHAPRSEIVLENGRAADPARDPDGARRYRRPAGGGGRHRPAT